MSELKGITTDKTPERTLPGFYSEIATANGFKFGLSIGGTTLYAWKDGKLVERLSVAQVLGAWMDALEDGAKSNPYE